MDPEEEIVERLWEVARNPYATRATLRRIVAPLVERIRELEKEVARLKEEGMDKEEMRETEAPLPPEPGHEKGKQVLSCFDCKHLSVRRVQEAGAHSERTMWLFRRNFVTCGQQHFEGVRKSDAELRVARLLCPDFSEAEELRGTCKGSRSDPCGDSYDCGHCYGHENLPGW